MKDDDKRSCYLIKFDIEVFWVNNVIFNIERSTLMSVAYKEERETIEKRLDKK